MKNLLHLGVMLLLLSQLIPVQIKAAEETEYYGGEITLQLHSSKTIELGEIGYDLIYQYGIKNGHSWYSDNRNIMTVPTEGRFSCTIYGSRIGETKLHYSCVYVRDNQYYDYKCYWDVKVVTTGSEYEGYPETWTSEGNYSTSWYNSSKSEFELSSSEDFAGLAYLVNKGYTFSGKTVKLTKDISLEGKNWSTIGIEDSKPFKGIFDGQGHIISDVYVSDQKDDQINYGVWGCIDGATIKNLTVKGNVVVIPYLTTYFPQQRIGGLVGYAKENCNIEKCRSDVKITYSRNIQREGSVGWIYMGGLVGNAPQSKISYCAHSGDLWCFQTPEEAYYHEVASNYIGGIVGDAGSDTNIEFCENSSSNIYSRMPYSTRNPANVYLGGIAGSGGDSFSYCRSVYTAFSVVAEHERFKNTDGLQIGGIQGAKPNYGGSYRNCYSFINMVWISSVSGRYNPAAFYGLGPGSCYNGYSNSDIIFDTNISVSKKNEGNYSSSGMKGNAFLEELNQYPVEKLGQAIWTPDEDGYPCIKETHSLGKKQPVLVTDITLNKTSLSLQIGQEETLTAIVKPDNATDKSVTWSSYPEGIVTVSSSGKVTAIALGETKVYCTANDGSGVQDICTVKVTDAVIKVTSITLNKTSLSLQTRQSETLTATVKPDNATDKTVTWSSKPEGIVTVSSTGEVTAIASGETKVYCTANDGSGVQATCDVKVNAEGIAINSTNFPDENFRNYLLSQSYGKDGLLTESEISGITELSIYKKNIISLKGIEYFKSLKKLECSYNQLTSLDISDNKALTELWCNHNQLLSLNLSKNTALEWLVCGNNQLTSLDVSNNMALTVLSCISNQLFSLDVSNNKILKQLACCENQLTALDVSSNSALWTLTCYGNKIKNRAMDELISSLPQNTTNDICYFQCINPTLEVEGNVCTKAQVATVKSKGWFPCYWDSDAQKYVEYEGSDPVMPEINADVNGDGSVDVADISSIISVMAGQSGNITEKSADVNNDGTVDVADIASVITRMAELVRQQHTIAEEE